MRILPVFVILACVAWQASAKAQDEEGRPAPPRGLLKRGHLGKKTTTTTTTPAPQEEVEYEDDAEYSAEEEVQKSSTEAPPSSTEGKKLVTGGVRPFRSNTDFLEALKRRREQAALAKHQGNSASSPAHASQPQDAPTEAPVKSNYSKKRFNSSPKESNNDDAPAPAKPSRLRFGRPSTRTIQESDPEEQNDAAPPARTGRTYYRRDGN